MSEKVGLAKALGQQRLSSLAGILVYALILVPVIIAALNALKLEAITQPTSQMLQSILNTIPALFGAGLVLAISYLIGRVVGSLTANLLRGIDFDSFLASLGLMKEAVEAQRPSAIVGHLVLVGIMLFAAIEAAQLLGFAIVADIVADFTVFAGQVIIALVIFAIGLYLAQLAGTALRSSGTRQAELLAIFARGAILVLAGSMALRQMGLASEIINMDFGLLLGAVAVAVAIAFRLGGRDLASRELEEWRRALRSSQDR